MLDAPVAKDSAVLWPAILTAIGALLGVILGFGLNEVSYLIRTRREDLRTISKTLAELLEVRHLLRILPLAVATLKKVIPGPISAPDEVMLRHVLWTFIPNTEGIQKRYEEAVSAVAAFVPLLAYELRSKDAVGPILGRLRSMVPNEPGAAPMWLQFEDEIVKFSLPKLEELLLQLAKLHGRKTAKEVEALLKRPFEPPAEFEKFMSTVIAAAVAQAAAAQAAQTRPGAAPTPPQT
jgi:hypothetical protein